MNVKFYSKVCLVYYHFQFLHFIHSIVGITFSSTEVILPYSQGTSKKQTVHPAVQYKMDPLDREVTNSDDFSTFILKSALTVPIYPKLECPNMC